LVVSRLHDDCAGRAERRARAARARAGAPIAHPRTHAIDPQSQLPADRGMARRPPRAVHLYAARRRSDRVRPLSPSDQLDRAGDAPADGKGRAHRAGRSLRDGRPSAHRLRRGAAVSPRGARACRARHCGLRTAECGFIAECGAAECGFIAECGAAECGFIVDCGRTTECSIRRQSAIRNPGIRNQSALRNPQSAVTTFDLLLVGYGNVARRFAEMLVERRQTLADDYGIRARVIGIATRREGPRYVAKEFGRTRARDTSAFVREACARDEPAARDGRLVVIETTTLDIDRGEPAVTHVRTAPAGGAHVVTANKGPAAF